VSENRTSYGNACGWPARRASRWTSTWKKIRPRPAAARRATSIADKCWPTWTRPSSCWPRTRTRRWCGSHRPPSSWTARCGSPCCRSASTSTPCWTEKIRRPRYVLREIPVITVSNDKHAGDFGFKLVWWKLQNPIVIAYNRERCVRVGCLKLVSRTRRSVNWANQNFRHATQLTFCNSTNFFGLCFATVISRSSMAPITRHGQTRPHYILSFFPGRNNRFIWRLIPISMTGDNK